MKKSKFILLALLTVFFACTSDFPKSSPKGMEIIGEPEFTTLYSFSLEELKEIENKLVASGVDVSGFIDKMVTRAADDNDFVSIEAIKVSVRTPNPGYPEYPDEYITISGVVIVPKYLLFPPTVRLMVSPPPHVCCQCKCSFYYIPGS